MKESGDQVLGGSVEVVCVGEERGSRGFRSKEILNTLARLMYGLGLRQWEENRKGGECIEIASGEAKVTAAGWVVVHGRSLDLWGRSPIYDSPAEGLVTGVCVGYKLLFR